MRLHLQQGNRTSKPSCSKAQFRSAYTDFDTHSSRSSAWPSSPCFFSMSTANASKMFPTFAFRYFVHCAVQCCWHFPNQPDAQQLWMVIFTLYFHPRLEPWALAPCTLLFCSSRSQLLGIGSEHPAWEWRVAWPCCLFFSLPPHAHPRLLK